jgi:ribosomal protein L40E
VLTAGQMSGIATIYASMYDGLMKGKVEVEIKDGQKRFCMHCGTMISIDAQNCHKCGMSPPSGVDTKNCSTCSTSNVNVILPHTAKFCDKCGARQPV